MPDDDLNTPCPHGGSIVTCNDCLDEYMDAERLVNEALGSDE